MSAKANMLAGRQNVVIAVVALAAAAILPLFFDPLSNITNNCILAAAYVVMALGLNIVVGFAGLLDLGYVAFYAFGAYAMGWFGSAYLVREDSSTSISIWSAIHSVTTRPTTSATIVRTSVFTPGLRNAGAVLVIRPPGSPRRAGPTGGRP